MEAAEARQVEGLVESWISIAYAGAISHAERRLREVDPDLFEGASPEAARNLIGAIEGGLRQTISTVLTSQAKAAASSGPTAFNLEAFAREAAEEVISGYLSASIQRTPPAIYGVRVASRDDDTRIVVDGLDDPAFAFGLRTRLASSLPAFAVVGFSPTPKSIGGRAVEVFERAGFRLYAQDFARVWPKDPDHPHRVEVIDFGQIVVFLEPYGAERTKGRCPTLDEFKRIIELEDADPDGAFVALQLDPIRPPIFLDEALSRFLAYLAGLPRTLSDEETRERLRATPLDVFDEKATAEAEEVFAALRSTGRHEGIFRDPKALSARGGILKVIFGDLDERKGASC